MTAPVVWCLALALALVVAVLVIRRILLSADRARADVERIVRADLEQLIADNPVGPWAPGTGELVRILEREHRPLPAGLVGFSERSGA